MVAEAAERADDGNDHPSPEELPTLALSTPAEALREARLLLAGRPDASAAAYAHQAAGIVLRDRGELPAALDHLRRAVFLLHRQGSADRLCDIRATYGAALVVAGRHRPGLRQLDQAVSGAHRDNRASVLMRRAYATTVLGRYDHALTDLRVALSDARRHHDVLWEARILQHRCYVHLCLGAHVLADSDAVLAQQLSEQVGQRRMAVQAVHNRGVAATLRGDIPTALLLFDEAGDRYESLEAIEPELVVDRGQAMLAAGLAVQAADATRDHLARTALQPVRRAELLMFAAVSELAAGRPELARDDATQARSAFRSQGRPGWELRARWVEVRARVQLGERSVRLLTTARKLDALTDTTSPDSALTSLVLARLAEDLGRHEVATVALAAAARHRRSGPPLTRATGWLATSLSADSRRSRLLACRRGLDALDEHRLLFGAAEIRATATGHARELSTLAIDAVAEAGTARQLLQWTERSRATSLAEPSVRPTDDAELARELAVVREGARLFDEAEASGGSTRRAVAMREAGEAAIRRRRRHLTGSGSATPVLDVGELLADLGETTLLVLVESRGDLLAVVARDGRVRRHRIGTAADVTKEADFARFALRRAAHARVPRLASTAARLQQATLGALAGRLGGRPLVVVPPSTLHTLPWGLLPALADVPFVVAPSARMWQRAVGVKPLTSSVLLATGPDLGTGGTEVEALAGVHPGATVLDPADVAGVLAGVDGARVAHLAAHGRFRSDSPLFSSLRFHDGDLFVHDLDRLRRAPHTVVLAACDSGVGEPVGADELLGMVSGLLRIGTTGVLASVVPVNDVAAVSFMVAVHRSLAAGGTLPEAALAGRRAVADDPLGAATAASFTAWGA